MFILSPLTAGGIRVHAFLLSQSVGLISYEKRGTCYYAKLKKLNLRYSLDAIYGMEKKR